MNLTRYISIAASVLLLASCAEKVQPVTKQMTFELGINGDYATKATATPPIGCTTDNLSDNAGVYLYGTVGSSTSYFDGSLLAKDSATGLWYISANKNTTWLTGTYYKLYCNAYNSSSAASLTMTSPSKLTVNEPTSYTYGSEASQMIDYMLSYTYTVQNGSSQPIVQIELEHALALVEFYVVKSEAIAGDVKVESMTLSNFYTSADINCVTQAAYGSDLYNTWQATHSSSQEQDGEYAFSNTFNLSTSTGGYGVSSADDKFNSEARMLLIAVPQNLTVSKKTMLKLVYYANEKVGDTDNYVKHTDSFILDDNGRPSKWESGHRYIYTVTIDTGIHFDGIIADWVPVDYIEGTVLPRIDD